MDFTNLKKGKLIINYSSGIKKDLDVVSNVGDYGYIVSRSVKINTINNQGVLETREKKEYNILLKDGRLSTEHWFDVYEFNHYGECIIGYERSILDQNELIKISDYLVEDTKNLSPEYLYRYGLINEQGKNTIKPLYDKIVYGEENTVVAYHNGLMGFVDTNTGEQITPIIFSHVSQFSEGLAAVIYKGLSGFVYRNKKMTNPEFDFEYAIKPKFEYAQDFKNGVSEVKYDGETKLINKNGDFITKETALLLTLKR